MLMKSNFAWKLGIKSLGPDLAVSLANENETFTVYQFVIIGLSN